ncbi:OmpA family protein [Hyphomicrobium sp. 1Nfss2.1]|uniref:OmpA family protein n=1 Tax=Hyphomicrobium sp. 1Nfss2.1 TaxID=3413936 RepID=UPI003C7B84FC
MRWLWGLIPIAMLAWLAVQAQHSHIEQDLERRSTDALRAAGHDWAVVAFDGRDGLLAGQPADRMQLAEAVAVVRNVWGVRIVRTRSIAPAIKDVPITPATDGGAPDRVLHDSEPLPLGDSVPVASADAAGEHDRMVAHTSPESGVWSEAHQSEPVLGDAPEADGTPAVTVATHEVAPASLGAEAIPATAETAPAASTVREAAEAKADAVAAADASADPAVAASSTGESAPADVVAHSQPVPDRDHSHSDAVASEVASTELPLRKPGDVAPPERSAAAPDQAPQESVTPPEQKPAEVAAVAPTTAVASSPKSPGADEVRTGDAATPIVPERKPVVASAKADGASTHDQGPAAVSSWLSGLMAPAPAKPPRFDTAALPPGNIAEPGSCIERVKEAARLAEVHFARGDARIDTSGKAVLDGLVGALNICPEATLHIAGHADASGKSRHNKVLSRHRARGVASYMIQKGIDDGRLVAVGYGDQKPVAPNDSKVNRAKNRRIELTVAARAAPLPPMPVRKQGTRNGLSAR